MRVDELYPTDRVILREVGLRDGLQLVKTFPDTDAKRDWIQREHAAGVTHFEVGSFLPAKRFPQFADVAELTAEVAGLPGARCAALALNERGINDALAAGVDELVCVVSATEEHSQANARRSQKEAVELVGRAAALAREGDKSPVVHVGLSMSFGCSIAGPVAPGDVVRLAEECLAAGADVVALADTVGFAGPRQVTGLCRELRAAIGERPFAIHLHDTRGLGLSNASAALDEGCRILDGALGGLGGCPFAPGATGNIVFEDLVFLCETKGFATGIDIDQLIELRALLAQAMPDETLYGAVARSGPPRNIPWAA